MLNLARYSCESCGEKFEAACLNELQEKKAKHKCVKANKRVERTAKVQQAHADQFVEDVVVDRIHQHKFDQLVEQGVIVAV